MKLASGKVETDEMSVLRVNFQIVQSERGLVRFLEGFKRMTGYTVHTGSSMKFSSGWDLIFPRKSASKKSVETQPAQVGDSVKSLKKASKKTSKKSAQKTSAPKAIKSTKKTVSSKRVKRDK